MAAKHYYLFGIRIWTVVIDIDVEEDEIENIETDEYTLAAQTTIADNEPPAFGFTPWTPDYMDWEDTK